MAGSTWAAPEGPSGGVKASVPYESALLPPARAVSPPRADAPRASGTTACGDRAPGKHSARAEAPAPPHPWARTQPPPPPEWVPGKVFVSLWVLSISSASATRGAQRRGPAPGSRPDPTRPATLASAVRAGPRLARTAAQAVPAAQRADSANAFAPLSSELRSNKTWVRPLTSATLGDGT